MTQEVLNILIIFIIPFILGVVFRVLFRNKKKGWIVSAVCGALVLAMAVIVFAIPSHGNEANGLHLWQAVCLLIGSHLSAGIIRTVRYSKKKNNQNSGDTE